MYLVLLSHLILHVAHRLGVNGSGIGEYGGSELEQQTAAGRPVGRPLRLSRECRIAPHRKARHGEAPAPTRNCPGGSREQQGAVSACWPAFIDSCRSLIRSSMGERCSVLASLMRSGASPTEILATTWRVGGGGGGGGNAYAVRGVRVVDRGQHAAGLERAVVVDRHALGDRRGNELVHVLPDAEGREAELVRRRIALDEHRRAVVVDDGALALPGLALELDEAQNHGCW